MRFHRPLAYHYISSFPLPDSLPVLSNHSSTLVWCWGWCCSWECKGLEGLCSRWYWGCWRGEGLCWRWCWSCSGRVCVEVSDPMFPTPPRIGSAPPPPLLSQPTSWPPLKLISKKSCLSLLDLVKIVITGHEKEALRLACGKNQHEKTHQNI